MFATLTPVPTMTEINQYPFPQDRAYDRENHMWSLTESDSARVTVGIDVLGLESLGDLAYVTLCTPGTIVKKGDSLGTLEAAKMTGDIIAPISGRVVEVNNAATSDPAVVNNDPYGQGWLVKVEPTNFDDDSAQLVSGDGIGPWVEAELDRYKKEGWLS